LEDVTNYNILAGDLLHSAVLSQHNNLLVSPLALLQLLELLFFGIVITYRDDSNNKHSEEDRRAFDPPVLKAVIDNANDQ
jgi:hypothetical protein